MRLKRLEQRLGVGLVVRGARGTAFTDEGLRLRDEAASLLRALEAVPERVAGPARAMAGSLRIVAPFGFGRRHVAPLLASFRGLHPAVVASLTLSEWPLADAAGMDVVIHVGAGRDMAWIGHPLAPNDRLLCASPAYVRRRGMPAHPSELALHDCLCLRENGEDVTRWRFLPSAAAPGDRDAGHAADGAARRLLQVRVRPGLSSNDGEVICDWALRGLGIMVRSEWEVAPLLRAGRLVPVLPQWRLDDAPVLALVPSRLGASARLQAFLAHARQALQPVPWRVRKGPASP